MKIVTLYGIPNCDTVKRARGWLAEHGYEVRFHDFKKQGVPPERLQAWVDAVGWERLVNRQGTSWRKLDERARLAVVDAKSARTLLLQQASVIKRPVIEWGSAVTVGFGAGFAPPR